MSSPASLRVLRGIYSLCVPALCALALSTLVAPAQPAPNMVAHAESAVASGLGLHHIDARARRLGGRAVVVSAPRHGTRVVVEIPLKR